MAVTRHYSQRHARKLLVLCVAVVVIIVLASLLYRTDSIRKRFMSGLFLYTSSSIGYRDKLVPGIYSPKSAVGAYVIKSSSTNSTVTVPENTSSKVSVNSKSEIPESTLKPTMSESIKSSGMKYMTNSKGAVLSVYIWEQAANAVTNVMNLQCWAGSFKMDVVEPTVVNSFVRGGIFHFNQDTSAERFRDLFDMSHWNQYSRDKKYSPLISISDFVKESSKYVIAVKISYSFGFKCPPNLSQNFGEFPYAFLSSHGFKIVRKVCIELLQEGRLRTQQEFDELVFGDLLGQGNFTVVFEEWRAIRNESENEGKLSYVNKQVYAYRIPIRDSHCTYQSLDLHPYHPSWTAVPPQNHTLQKSLETESVLLKKSKLGVIPSDQVINKTMEFRTQYMNNKPYVAIAMRMELLKQGIASKNSYQSCLETAKSLWKYATEKYGLNQTYITSDIGKYGSHSWGGDHSAQQFQEDIMKLVKSSTTLVQSSDLKTVMNSAGDVKMAWTQGILAAQARCVIFLGGGAFQGLISNIHSAMYLGKDCFVHLDPQCKVTAKLGFQ